MTKQRKTFRDAFWLVLPFLPILALRFARVSMVFPDEAGVIEPWYAPFTSVLWWFSSLYLAPATAITLLLKTPLFSVAHVFIMVAYAAIISYVIYWIRQRRAA
jgi:hypothetical protein